MGVAISWRISSAARYFAVAARALNLATLLAESSPSVRSPASWTNERFKPLDLFPLRIPSQTILACHSCDSYFIMSPFHDNFTSESRCHHPRAPSPKAHRTFSP